jgi:gliding motility-associated-like protein
MRMKQCLFFIGIIFLNFTVNSQNLVPNGDFEYHTQPACCGQNITTAYPWFSPYWNCRSGYFNTDCTDADNYMGVPFNDCGYQIPHSGNGYAILKVYAFDGNYNHRYSIEIKLNESLLANTCYHCSFWLNLADRSKYKSNNVQAYFSPDSINDTSHYWCTNLPFMPQVAYSGTTLIDSINWFHFDETFVASGGERFLTIGNFLDDSHTSVQLAHMVSIWTDCTLYIDDVAVYPCDAPIVSAQAGEDTEICPEDNITLGMPHYDYYKYKWFESDGTIIDTNNSITVSPQIETTYVLWIKDFLNQESYDTVTVRIKDCSPEPSVEIPNVFTPNGDGHNDKFKVQGNKIEKINLLVYNRWGNKVFEGNEADVAWDGKSNSQPCAAGVYYYTADITFTNGKKETKQGTVTLIR